MWVDMQSDVGVGATPLAAVVLAAADVDAEARDLHDMIRSESLAGATAFVTHLADVGGRRSDIGIERAVRTVHQPARERYEASVDGRVVGRLLYQRSPRLVVITRTEVDAGFDDHGVAGALVRRALDDARADAARRVVPLCHYAAWWISRHRDFAPLLYDAAAD